MRKKLDIFVIVFLISDRYVPGRVRVMSRPGTSYVPDVQLEGDAHVDRMHRLTVSVEVRITLFPPGSARRPVDTVERCGLWGPETST